MNTLTFKQGTAEQQQAALALNIEIAQKKEILGSALADFCDALKRMRDGKLYTVYGFEDFGAYCEAAHGIKSRMAYKYIKAYEDCGRALMEQNAAAGITKLALLSEISSTERADFAEENDLEGMSVAEVKEKLQEITGLREQLSFYETENDKAAAARDEKDAELERLREQVKALKAAPVDTVGADADAIAAARKEAEAAAKKEAQAEKEKLKQKIQKLEAEKEMAVAEAKKEAAAAAEKQRTAAEKAAKAAAEEQIAAAEAAAAAEKQRAEALAKELQLAASKESTQFAIYFEQLQSAYNKMLEAADALTASGSTEQAEKLKTALKKALTTLQEGL